MIAYSLYSRNVRQGRSGPRRYDQKGHREHGVSERGFQCHAEDVEYEACRPGCFELN